MGLLNMANDQGHRMLVDANNTFLEIIDNSRGNGLTTPELQKLIQKRPELWGRFSVWLGRLPADKSPGEDLLC